MWIYNPPLATNQALIILVIFRAKSRNTNFGFPFWEMSRWAFSNSSKKTITFLSLMNGQKRSENYFSFSFRNTIEGCFRFIIKFSLSILNAY